MKRNYDLTKVITKDHVGKWVALSQDQTKVLAVSENLEELEKQIDDDTVIVTKVKKPGVSYAF
jgi:hypothetical protein